MPISFLTPDDLPPAFDPSAINARLDLLESNVAALEVAPQDPAIVALQSAVADLTARVTALEPVPPPPPPPPPPPAELNLQLLGGWRLVGPFSRGQLAIDHATMRAFVVGHSQRNEVYEYQLPPMGTGSDIAAYPRVDRINLIPAFWQGGYGNGIVWDGGQLKVVPKRFYDTAPPATTTVYAQDGTTQVVNVPRQRFGGFVKGVGTLELGGGGYESGQGWARGPTLAGLDGAILIDFPATNDPLKCCPREPNYWPADAAQSAWVCMGPVDGKGYWSCDRVCGGGIRHSTGIYYWGWMGTGDLNYNRQNETFAATNKTYLYRFDPATYQLVGWKGFPIGKVCGQEMSPDGKYVYLVEGDAWTSGSYQVDPVLKVYEVK